MEPKRIPIFRSVSACQARTKRISPRIHIDTKFASIVIGLPNNKKCYVTTWMGEVPNLLLLTEPKYHNGPRTLKSVICQHPLTDAEAEHITRTVSKITHEELYAIVPSLFYGEQFGFALTAERVVGSDKGLICGNLLYCTNNRSLTQVKELVLAITDDENPIGYCSARDKELNKRFTNSAYRYVNKSICALIDLFNY